MQCEAEHGLAETSKVFPENDVDWKAASILRSVS